MSSNPLVLEYIDSFKKVVQAVKDFEERWKYVPQETVIAAANRREREEILRLKGELLG